LSSRASSDLFDAANVPGGDDAEYTAGKGREPMPTNQDLLILRRTRRWSAGGAVSATLVLILWYIEHASRLIVFIAVVQAVCLWGMFVAQTRALRSGARSPAGERTL
jgi:hypothetical protein